MDDQHSTKRANGVRHIDMESMSMYQSGLLCVRTNIDWTRKPIDTGMARLCLTDDDAQVREWLTREIQKLGCSQSRNMFARQSGRLQSSKPMIAMGSHLDTQPRGGRYDGILGVVAELEVLRTMRENGFQTSHDIGLVNWTKYANDIGPCPWCMGANRNSEEGARFPKSMCSSGVWAGAIPVEKAWDLRDIHDPAVTLRSELERHGLQVSIACSHDPTFGYPLGAHFELHIEQGPILQSTGRSICAVSGAQGYRWLTFTVHGRDAHTGATPLDAWRDPLLAAARMIAASNDIAQRHGVLVLTGILKVPSNTSTTTVASEVTFSLEIQHSRDEVEHAVQDECLQSFLAIKEQDG